MGGQRVSVDGVCVCVGGGGLTDAGSVCVAGLQ